MIDLIIEQLHSGRISVQEALEKAADLTSEPKIQRVLLMAAKSFNDTGARMRHRAADAQYCLATFASY